MVKIPRELAERCLAVLRSHAGLPGQHQPATCAAELSAALSAPEKPLTAEECRAFGKRLETLFQGVDAYAAVTVRASVEALAQVLEKPVPPAYHTPATPEDATQT